MGDSSKPLSGIRVIDMTRVLSGPLCTVLLADLGAEVIKIETQEGDITRQAGGHMRNGVTAMFLALNRGKKSFTTDLRTSGGQAAVAALVKTADVFVENFRPGVAAAMGLDAATLRRHHPELIYVSINGYGAAGPMADEPAYDTVVQGQSGMIARQMRPDGEIDHVRSFPVDKITGMFAAQAITAALFRRERDGGGCEIEVPMFDTAMYYLWIDVLAEFTFAGGDYTRVFDTWRSSGVTKTADGHIVLLVVSLKEIHGALRAAGLPELTSDERFTSLPTYLNHLDAFRALTGDAFSRQSTEVVLERLRAEGVAASSVMQPEEVMADQRLTGGDFFLRWQHHAAGDVRQARPPARFDGRVTTPALHAPELGEHTAELASNLE